MKRSVLPIRKIVVAGVLSAIAIVLGWTRLGFIPVPTPAADATIMHVPAIIGGVLEGPIVGGIVGTIFGIFSFIQGAIPAFKDPLVAILPRVFIGIVAWLAYRLLRRIGVAASLILSGLVAGAIAAFSIEVAKTSLPVACLVAGTGLGLIAAYIYLAFKGESESIALSVAALLGTATNSVGVLGMGVLRGYWASGVAVTVGLTQGIPEAIVAAIITVAVVLAWKRIETGRGQAKM
jgi:uncharacterized membrane protein